MKTKGELIKIYSSYLAYELQISTDDEDWIETVIGLNNEALETNVGNYWDYTVKPILYSMDMLTKEIEHKGERFIPTVWLRDNHAEFDISKKDMETLISMFLHIFRSPFSAPHYFIDKLLEWHFNVFGLDESEYIKKEIL